MQLIYKNKSFDLGQPIDISTPLHDGEAQINCYFAPAFKTEAFTSGSFIGDIKKGGMLNYKNVTLNPHGNGTHTECLAHIADIPLTINKALNKFHFVAQLITITPLKIENGDLIISADQIQSVIKEDIEALIIRTLPNGPEKLTRNYNNTNPPYLHHKAAEFIRQKNIQHLLIDLPSVDREEDGGKLLAHRAFWNFTDESSGPPRLHSTITELIFVPADIDDDIYLLNLQIASFELDAAPSKPILYPLIEAE